MQLTTLPRATVMVELEDEREIDGPSVQRAEHLGTCPACNREIVPGPGLMVTRRGGRWIHTRCDRAALAGRANGRWHWELPTE